MNVRTVDISGLTTGQFQKKTGPATAQAATGRPADPAVKTGPEGKESAKTPETENIIENRAVFAVEKNRYVVIQILDKNGKVITQMPPEEYIESREQLRTQPKNLFKKEV
ncbi:MAG: hypothetical protein M0Z59_00770 [Nitrospiraceae bacterium]|nr:hypothetical protein [Nitrospiraceae bacterium]